MGETARWQRENHREQARLPVGGIERRDARRRHGIQPMPGRRLPHTRVEETVFLTPDEFRLLRDHIQRERWKNLATWLVTTGMRFSEATALSAADIDVKAKTCRINKTWKYSGDYRPEIGHQRRRNRSARSACRLGGRGHRSCRAGPAVQNGAAILFARKSSLMADGSLAARGAIKAGLTK